MATLPTGLPAPLGDATFDERTVQRYAQAIGNLLPPGKLWRLIPTSNIWKYLEVFALTAARVAARVQDFLRESDPRTASQLLPEWESNLGIPDGCITSLATTDGGRQQANTAKYLASGGQSPAYFIGVAANLGYTVTIVRSLASEVLRAGFRCGARCYDTAWAFTWQITVTSVAATAVSTDAFECVLRKLGPAHGTAIFIYP